MFTGGRKNDVFLRAITNAEGEIEYVPVTTEDGESVSAIQSTVGMPQSPTLLTGEVIHAILSGTSGGTQEADIHRSDPGGRQSWRQLR
jgi:hypothetical protein